MPGRRPIAHAPDRLLVAAIAIGLALQAGLVFLQPINWDEFRYLADVHAYRRGEMSAWLQTLHVQLFFWLPGPTGNEIDQIVTARAALLMVECGTAALVYRCGRHFMAREPALFALLCYLTCSYVIRHGASFRYDPLCTLFMMSALALLLEKRVTRVNLAAAGIFTALAGLVTIKAVLFVPTLAIVIWWRTSGSGGLRAATARAAAVGGAALIAFALLATLHAQSLAAPGAAAEHRIIARGLSKTLIEAGLVPRADVLVRSFVSDPFLWLFVLVGLVLAVRKLGSPGRDRAKAVALLGFALPLLTLIFYRNAYPYYYVFVMAPACLLAGHAASRLERPLFYPVVTLLLATLAITHATRAASPALAVQRAHVEVVHELFPRPVPYIDRSSMISSFPKAGFFMSSWGMENYRAAGQRIMGELLLGEGPVLLIANSPVLADAVSGSRLAPSALFPEDAAILRDNYVHHWGLLWVAGKRLVSDRVPAEFEILVPAAYTIEAVAPVALDGVLRAPGAIVHLPRGRHSIESPGGRQAVTLRYGSRLPVPSLPPPPGPIFTDL